MTNMRYAPGELQPQHCCALCSYSRCFSTHGFHRPTYPTPLTGCRTRVGIVSNCLFFIIILVTMFDRYLRSIQTATPIETSHSINMVVQHCYSKSASKSIYIMRMTSFHIPFHPKLSSPPSPSLHACNAAPTICSWVVDVHGSYLNDFS